MSPGDLQIILIVVAIPVSIGLVWWGGSWLLNGKFIRLRKAGPGATTVPAPTDPWRRFCGALSAMYARAEVAAGQLPGTLTKPDQYFFGYGVILSVGKLRRALRANWAVTDPASAKERVSEGIHQVTAETAAVTVARGVGGEQLRERLERAGVPETARQVLLATLNDKHRYAAESGDRSVLAFDIGRTANLVRWSAGLGLLTEAQAHAASDLLGGAAVAGLDSWDDYGARYVEGLAAFQPGARNGPFVIACRWLTTAKKSPWQKVDWP